MKVSPFFKFNHPLIYKCQPIHIDGLTFSPKCVIMLTESSLMVNIILERENNMTNNKHIKEICCCAMTVALMTVCSWISINIGEVPITLQTFGVFTAVGLLGGKLGTMAVCAYILLGAAGLPVFAGFTGGFGIITGTTGGYIVGFVFSALAIWLIQSIFGESFIVSIIAMSVGILVCYAFGTAWFMAVYAKANGAASLSAVLGLCVVPFILPDALKIACAAIISKRVKKIVKI